MVWSKRGWLSNILRKPHVKKNSGSRDMAQNAFSQSDRSIFRNHILHTNPKKMLFFPKKNQKFYFFIPILKKFNFFIFSKKVQKFFFIQILKKFNFFNFSKKKSIFLFFQKKKLFSVKKNEKLTTRCEAPCKFFFLAHE